MYPAQIYLVDMIGTFTFALYGAYVAMRKEFDIFGIFVCAFITAVGGGTLRELMLNQDHLFYFVDCSYLAAVCCGIACSIMLYEKFDRIQLYMRTLDAIGIATFAFIGAHRAAQADLNWFGIIFMATLTAAGGGVMRDVTMREVPQFFYSEFYATPAIFAGAIYCLLQHQMEDPKYIVGLLLLTFLVRMIGIRLNIKLWVPKRTI